MTALSPKLIKRKVLRIRLDEQEWIWLQQSKQQGTSYNMAIRRAIIAQMNIKFPF